LKFVIDTNVAVSGLLWGGPPNKILQWSRVGTFNILECEETMDEIKRVLLYGKFGERLSDLNTTVSEDVAYFMNLATFVPSPDSIPDAIKADPFDNYFLALASENNAYLIISGDRHLLDLESYKDIQIVSPSQGTKLISTLISQRKAQTKN